MHVKAINFDTLSVSFKDGKESLLQCDGFDASFNLSQYLMASINALIARGKTISFTFSCYICRVTINIRMLTRPTTECYKTKKHYVVDHVHILLLVMTPSILLLVESAFCCWSSQHSVVSRVSIPLLIVTPSILLLVVSAFCCWSNQHSVVSLMSDFWSDLRLPPYFMCSNSEGSGETARKRLSLRWSPIW